MFPGRLVASCLLLGLAACAADPAEVDGVDDSFTDGKADGLGIAADGPEACSILRAANEATEDELDDDAGLDARAASGIVRARPLATLVALDAVPYVGALAATRLLDYATQAGLTCDDHPPPPACAATGGTYDGVAFTADEECHAVDFMNHARFSELRAIGTYARGVIYDLCAAQPCDRFRRDAWTSVGELAARDRIGRTSIAQVKAAAAAWAANGLPYDTVAHTWAERASLDGAPLQLERVYGTSVRSERSTTGWVFTCLRVKDAPEATTYLEVCVRHNPTDSGTTCTGDAAACVDRMVGQWVRLRGTLYGSRVTMSDSGPDPARDLP